MRIFWRGVLPALAAALIGLASMPTAPAQAQTAERCFSETGFCISGRIREFWEQNGGLPVFGFPIGPQQQETIEGKALQVQRFERNRLELHPENGRPYDVLLGRLGADRLAQLGKDWQTYPKTGNQPGCRFFPETGQSVCGAILGAWRANGLEIDGQPGKTEIENLGLFGLPLSGVVTETMVDGVQRQVQHFERARFELHPQNAPPFNVLLGLLGVEIRNNAGSGGGGAVNQCNDVPEPVSARLRPGKCVSPGTELSIDIFGFQPNEETGFWITAPDGSRVGTVQTLNIGPTGAVDGLPFRITNDFIPGVWFIVFQGVSTGHQSIVYFKVQGGQNAAPPQQPPPASGNIPAPINATAEPNSANAGATFTFIGRGFTPGEAVGIYLTAPDKSVFGAPFQDQATDGGLVGVTLRSARDFPRGIWAITFEGVDSGHKAIAYFEIK